MNLLFNNKKIVLLVLGILVLNLLLPSRGKAQQPAVFQVDKVARVNRLLPFVSVEKDGKIFYYHTQSGMQAGELYKLGNHRLIAKKGGKFGLVDDMGKSLTAFNYDHIWDLSGVAGSFLGVKRADKFGVISLDGFELTPVIYHTIRSFGTSLIGVQGQSGWGWIDGSSGELIQEPYYDQVFPLMDTSVLTVGKNGRFGVVDLKGKLLIPIEAESRFYAVPTSRGYLLHGQDQNRKDVLYGLDGKELLRGDYPDLFGQLASDYLRFSRGDKYGLINPYSQDSLPAVYSKISDGVRNLFLLEKDGKTGVWSGNSSSWLLPMEFDEVQLVDIQSTPRYFQVNGTDDASVLLQADYLNAAQREKIRYQERTSRLDYFIRARKGQQLILYSQQGKELFHLEDASLLPGRYSDQCYFFAQHSDGSIAILDATGTILLQSDSLRFSSNYRYVDGLLETDLSQRNRFVLLCSASNSDELSLFDLQQRRFVVEHLSDMPESGLRWLSHDVLLVADKKDDQSSLQFKLYQADEGEFLTLDGKVSSVFGMVSKEHLLVGLEFNGNQSYGALMDMQGHIIYENEQWDPSDSRERDAGYFALPAGVSADEFNAGWYKLNDQKNVFIDPQGREKHFSAYNRVSSFYMGHAFTIRELEGESRTVGESSFDPGYRYGLIDSTGKEIFPPVWQSYSMSTPSKYLLVVEQDGKFGILDRRGKLILPAVYDEIQSSYASDNRQYFLVKKDGHCGLVDDLGEILIPPIYQNLLLGEPRDQELWPVLVFDGQWYYFLNQQGEKLSLRSREVENFLSPDIP